MGDASGRKKQAKSQSQKSRISSDKTGRRDGSTDAAAAFKNGKKKLGTKAPARATNQKDTLANSRPEAKPPTPPLTQRTNDNDETSTPRSDDPGSNSQTDKQNEQQPQQQQQQQQQEQQPRQQGSKDSASQGRASSGSRSTSPSKPTTFDTSVRVVMSANRWRMKQRAATKLRVAAAAVRAAKAKAKASGDADADAGESSPPASPTPDVAQATYNDDIIPTVNGMRVFGISKGQMQRAIVKFTEPPEKQPLTVCFHFPSTFLTHRYVLDMMRSALKKVEGGRVKVIQFIDRNTIHGTQGLDNRWLVTVNKPEAVECLVEDGFLLYSRRIVIRRYDDILTQEYQEFQDYMEHENRLYTMRKKLVNVAHGEEEDVNELRQLMANNLLLLALSTLKLVFAA